MPTLSSIKTYPNKTMAIPFFPNGTRPAQHISVVPLTQSRILPKGVFVWDDEIYKISRHLPHPILRSCKKIVEESSNFLHLMYPIPPQHIAFFAALPPDVVVDQTSQEWPRFQQIFTELTQKDPLVFRKEIVKNYPRALLEKAILEKLKNTQVPYFLTCQEIQLYTKKEDSRFVITMPFYKKGDLINKIIELNASYDKSAPQERLKKQKETLDYAYWVCKAVTHLHGLGILHRDLKPDNFLLNDENIPVLIDFECACFESSINPAPLETPEYSAPEGSYDRKSDIWSLGMSLFQILQPFWDETDPWLQELSKNWTSQNKKYVQSLEQIPPSTNPNPLAILINTMIEQDPRRRPEAFQVLDEITRIQASLHPEMPQ